MSYEPQSSDRFTIGLWRTAYAGREVFGAEDIRETFFLVRLPTRSGWDGPRTFDVKPYRTDTAEQFDADPEIAAILAELDVADPALDGTERWSGNAAETLRGHEFDFGAMADRSVGYQRLDQLTFDLLTGTR